ncbi:DUF4173 domain-containing protein [Micromonospora sp. NPDC049559]|uniref:DUF4153 domain-containing protein n=1 Tax=Micromonospora sp. NPDC049559 TaxID=3155923 RepID=UPI0034313515
MAPPGVVAAPPYPGYPPPLPPRPSVWSRRWPGPVGPAHRAVLATVAGAAVVSAVSIPLTRAGVGWLVAVVAGTVALGTAVWSASHSGPGTARSRPDATGAPGRAGEPDTPGEAGGGRSRWRRVGATRLFWAAATVALVGAGTIRAAGWLFVLCLLTAGVTACLATADGRSVRGLLLSGLIPPAAVFRSLPWAARGLRAGGRVGASAWRGVLTAAVSIVLLIVFGSLFASADGVFADLVGDLLPELSGATVVRWIFVGGLVGAGLLGGAYVLVAPPELGGLDGPARRRLRRAEWAVPVALLDLLFAAFVLVQLTVLFGGSAHVLRTSGLTYAEYARSGFWQLLAVSALTLLVLAAAARWAPRAHRADRLLVRLLLGGLALLSLVVVASALYRMNVYAQAYGATRLRLLVAACEIWLGLVFVLVLVAGVRLRGAWVPRLVLGTAVLVLLGLVALNPDRLIADRNVDRYAETGRIDLRYLSGLSADAAPAIDRLPEPDRGCALGYIAYQLDRRPDDWREYNLGRERARRLIEARPVRPDRYLCGEGTR